MSVYPERRKGRLTGKWIAEVTRNGAREARKRFDTQREGQRWKDTYVLAGEVPKAEEPVVDLGPSLEDVVAEARQKKPEWVRGRDPSGQRRVDYVVARIGPRKPVREICTKDLDNLVADLKRRPGRSGRLSEGTVNRYLSAISAVLTFAKERKYLTDVPTVPWQTEGGKRLHWVTEDAEDAICAHMLEHERYSSALTVRALAASGMRWGELETLEPEQIDIPADPTQQAWVRLWETKTDDPRSIPIDRELARDLKALVAKNGVPNHSTFSKHYKAALKSAGQSPKLCVHSLRHSTATRLVQKGVHLAVVQRFLGHKAIQTTMRYVKVADSDLEAASKKLSPRAGYSAASAEVPEMEPVVSD